jgi:hypothetical protein
VDFNAGCAANAATQPFAQLRVNGTDVKIRCMYEVTADIAPTVNPSPPAACTAAPGSLVGSWYYIVATCDMDGNGGTYATFCMSSWNSQQTNANYGS